MNIELNRDSRQPMYLQLQSALRGMILTGALPPGCKLPASREMARLLGLSRNTVDEAYGCLADGGLTDVRPGRGTYVRGDIRAERQRAEEAIDWEARINETVREYVRYRTGIGAVRQGGRDVISFTSLAPDHQLFAVDAFRRCMNDVLVNEGGVLLNYGYVRGYEPLRRYLIGYLEAKGIDCGGNELLIVNGFRQGLELTVRALCRPGDTVACESPTYNGALGMFSACGVRCAGVPMDAEGVDPEVLERVLRDERPALLYLIPTYHNPTGVNMTMGRRREVLALAQRYAVPVLEDGFSEELRYDGTAYPSLKALDGGGCVIYAGSFSKVLFPGLRVGWLLAPKALAYYLYHLKYNDDIHTGLLHQAGLWAFCERGYLERHLRYCRKIYRERMAAMDDALRRHLTGLAKWTAGSGGFSFWLKFPTGTDARALAERAPEYGVAYAPGDSFFPGGGGRNYVRLGFSRLEPAQIETGVTRLSRLFGTATHSPKEMT
ncbi:MAG: PLP-dependent aminotransferase family protein [Clostridiales bacterium]|nr:PLP-dependent aminotransferase family protein [Clostridiales bacterium]